jgi:hypothetical protein
MPDLVVPAALGWLLSRVAPLPLTVPPVGLPAPPLPPEPVAVVDDAGPKVLLVPSVVPEFGPLVPFMPGSVVVIVVSVTIVEESTVVIVSLSSESSFPLQLASVIPTHKPTINNLFFMVWFLFIEL